MAVDYKVTLDGKNYGCPTLTNSAPQSQMKKWIDKYLLSTFAYYQGYKDKQGLFIAGSGVAQWG